MHMPMPSTLSILAQLRMLLTKMATQQHPTNAAMAENQAVLASVYLDAQAIPNVMNRPSATS
jgi:hypothetical protein